MLQRGIRGAITIEENTIEAVHSATVELISEIMDKNNFDAEDICSVIFTLTDDIDCVYPAKIAREVFTDWKYVPMVCFNEMKIKGSLTKSTIDAISFSLIFILVNISGIEASFVVK